MRLALGPRDVKNATVEVARRDTREKETVSRDGLTEYLQTTLDAIQQNLFDRAKAFQEDNTTSVDTYDAFKDVLDSKGGFVLAHWDGTAETEERIKNETKATIRCVPLDQAEEAGTDPVSGEPSRGRVLFARAY